jgi:hypothetical protein
VKFYNCHFSHVWILFPHTCFWLDKSEPLTGTYSVSNTVKAVPQHAYVGAGRETMYRTCSFTTSALDGGEWSGSRSGRALPPGKDHRYHWTGGSVGSRAGLDREARGKILCLCRRSNPDRSVVQPVVRHYTA